MRYGSRAVRGELLLYVEPVRRLIARPPPPLANCSMAGQNPKKQIGRIIGCLVRAAATQSSKKNKQDVGMLGALSKGVNSGDARYLATISLF